jgi:hypothetical protein
MKPDGETKRADRGRLPWDRFSRSLTAGSDSRDMQMLLQSLSLLAAFGLLALILPGRS